MKLTPTEERALLRRIEDKRTTPEDVLVVEALLDTGSDGSLLAAIREMTAAMTESAVNEQATKAEVEAWRLRLEPILERIAKAEEAALRIAEEELERSRAHDVRDAELAKLQIVEHGKTSRVKVERIVAVVLAVLGLVGTIAGYLYGSGVAP